MYSVMVLRETISSIPNRERARAHSGDLHSAGGDGGQLEGRAVGLVGGNCGGAQPRACDGAGAVIRIAAALLQDGNAGRGDRNERQHHEDLHSGSWYRSRDGSESK